MGDAAHLCLTSDAVFMFSLPEHRAGRVCGHELKKAEAEQDLLEPETEGSVVLCSRRSDLKMPQGLVKWVAQEQFIT